MDLGVAPALGAKDQQPRIQGRRMSRGLVAGHQRHRVALSSFCDPDEVVTTVWQWKVGCPQVQLCVATVGVQPVMDVADAGTEFDDASQVSHPTRSRRRGCKYKLGQPGPGGGSRRMGTVEARCL